MKKEKPFGFDFGVQLKPGFFNPFDGTEVVGMDYNKNFFAVIIQHFFFGNVIDNIGINRLSFESFHGSTIAYGWPYFSDESQNKQFFKQETFVYNFIGFLNKEAFSVGINRFTFNGKV
jgi:hypothetical protein